MFERMLWRVCRGNVFVRQSEVMQPLEDPVTVSVCVCAEGRALYITGSWAVIYCASQADIFLIYFLPFSFVVVV